MLDVHPPHEKTHTWTDFFIHIATICVGLLIAVGLEQAVEALHRHHERKELLTALQAESARIQFDTTNVDRAMTTEIAWLRRQEAALSQAASTHTQPVLEPRPKIDPWDTPNNGVYKAAAADARLSLLTPEEVVAYGELNAVLLSAEPAYEHLQNIWRENAAMRREFEYGHPGTDSHSTTMTSEQMHTLYTHYVQQENARYDYRSWCRSAHGAALALSNGELDLNKIEESEKKFYLHD